MKTIPLLNRTLLRMGSDVTYHREDAGSACPCLTPEGFRDPAWHRTHTSEPVCNEQGMLTNPIEFKVKASIQPASTTRRMVNQRADALLGDVQRDDHLGVFPVTWEGNTLDFSDWSEAGEDYIVYDNRRFVVVAADKIPDIDGDPNHHYEVGLRLVRSDRGL